MGGYWALYPFGSALAKVQASIDAAWVYTCWSCLLLSVGERIFQLPAGAGDIGSP